MSRCWDVANFCPLVVLYNMSVAGVRVVEFGTKRGKPRIDGVVSWRWRYAWSMLRIWYALLMSRLGRFILTLACAGLEPIGNTAGNPARFMVETFSAGRGDLTVTILNPRGVQEPVSKAYITTAIRLRYDYDTTIPRRIRLRRKWSKLRFAFDSTVIRLRHDVVGS